MTAANPVEQLAVSRHVEVAHRIGAQERERLHTRQLVPQILQANRSRAIPRAPEQVTISPKTRTRAAVRDARHCSSTGAIVAWNRSQLGSSPTMKRISV